MSHATGKTAKKQQAVVPKKSGSGNVLHSSFIVGDLPADMRVIYARTVQHLLPKHQKSIPTPELLEEADGATMVFEVASKEIAEAMFKRLQNANVYGNRWKVEYHPVSAVTPQASEPVLVDVTLSPPGLKADVAHALSAVQGFLAVDESLTGGTTEHLTDVAVPVQGGDDCVAKLVATFAEEGPAIHARAVLSGRMVGCHGSRMYLAIRRRPSSL